MAVIAEFRSTALPSNEGKVDTKKEKQDKEVNKEVNKETQKKEGS